MTWLFHNYHVKVDLPSPRSRREEGGSFGLIKLNQVYEICLTGTEMFFSCLFSTELDVEDFDAFLERVKARSLGSSPFVCKSSPINDTLRVCFFKKNQDWILKSKRMQKQLLHFFTKIIKNIYNLSDHGASKEPKNPHPKWILRFLEHIMRDLGLICLVNKHSIP